MKIRRVVLAGFYPPPFAGEPVHVKQLGELLRSRGLSVEILNLNRHAGRSSKYHSAGGRGLLLWRLFTLADRTSILHLHTNGHSRKSWLMILVASLSARQRGAPAILTLHSGLLPAYVAGFGKVRRALARWILGAFARVVCVNDEIARAVQRQGLSRRAIAIIPAFLGVPAAPDLAAADHALVRAFHPLLVAVAGGEEEPERGLAVVLQAVRRLAAPFPSVGVVLMGWQTGPKTRPLIDELGLGDRAICLGEVPHDRCLGFLRAGDVVVRSTFADGDAITVREALALGVPVVASDTAYRPAGVTVFGKGDVSDLVLKLTRVLTVSGGGSRSPQAAGDQPAADIWRLYSELVSPEEDAGPVRQDAPRRAETS
jgi:glycosyltransferase involved in cell wall biosynthesis